MTTTTRAPEFCPKCHQGLYKMEGDAVVILNGSSHVRISAAHVAITCLRPLSRVEKCRAVVDVVLDKHGNGMIG